MILPIVRRLTEIPIEKFNYLAFQVPLLIFVITYLIYIIKRNGNKKLRTTMYNKSQSPSASYACYMPSSHQLKKKKQTMKKLFLMTLFLSITNLIFSQESLKIIWLEKYEWKLLSNQENDNVHIIEIIPGKEEAENWTMLGQMMSIKGALNVPMDKAKDLMFEQTKTTSPKAKLTVIEKNEQDEYPWILFKIENPNFEGDKKPESQLWYIRQGKTSLYVNFIAKKKKKLKEEFVEEWSKVFKESEFVELGKENKKEENKN